MHTCTFHRLVTHNASHGETMCYHIFYQQTCDLVNPYQKMNLSKRKIPFFIFLVLTKKYDSQGEKTCRINIFACIVPRMSKKNYTITGKCTELYSHPVDYARFIDECTKNRKDFLEINDNMEELCKIYE